MTTNIEYKMQSEQIPKRNFLHGVKGSTKVGRISNQDICDELYYI